MPDETSVAPVDDLTTTSHTLHTACGELAYTATTGRLVLRDEHYAGRNFADATPRAEMFVVAYTLDGADPATRPVLIAFPGGPGSSTIWLHLGLLGPRRVEMGDAGALTPPPWGVVDNAETLLAHADLVFVDPVSAGFSRAATGAPPDFHGFTADISDLGAAIRLWITRNARWGSPKYLMGESYGTVRGAALAQHLQDRYGLYLNGVVLCSPVLDMATIRFTEGNDLPYALFLPTYAAVAHHHGLHGDRALRDVLDEAEEFASGEYPLALARGARLSDDEQKRIAERVAGLTGLSVEWVRNARLRVEASRFFREVLRPSGRTVGRLDGRFTGWEAEDGGEAPTYDPSLTAIAGPYNAAFNAYIRAELGYATDLPYESLNRSVQPWSYAEFEGAAVSVAGRLSAAMRANPHLRVQMQVGYHDGATPHFAAEHVLAQLPIPAQLRGNVEMRHYEAGHMIYVHDGSRRAQAADIAAFVTAH